MLRGEKTYTREGTHREDRLTGGGGHTEGGGHTGGMAIMGRRERGNFQYPLHYDINISVNGKMIYLHQYNYLIMN